MEQKNITSELRLEKLLFDKIEFSRIGLHNDNEISFQMQTEIAKNTDGKKYKVTLILSGVKPEEYTLEISITGYFSFEERTTKMDNEMQEHIINKNTVAILMPYLRSEVSLITAQPEVDCVVLPPFNINKMMDD